MAREAELSDLQGRLEQAEARIRELDHRIRNDLQLIISILVLQTRSLPDGPARGAVRGAMERVSAVALAHRSLNALATPQVGAADLVRELVEEIARSEQREDVELRLRLDPVLTPARGAAPLALIVNELVRNALRQAFPPPATGHVTISLEPTGEAIRLCVDGEGVSADGQSLQGFGATLVGLLARQLRGEFDLLPGDRGLHAEVRFPRET